MLGLALAAVACASGGTAQYGKLAGPVPLANGAPRTQCERGQWYELVPARVQARGMTNSIFWDTTYRGVREGYAVFPHGGGEPKVLEPLWPVMSEPELAQLHQSRIDPVDDAERASLYWLLGGIVGAGAGIGIGMAVLDESEEAGAALILSGVGLAIVGLVGGLVAQPSGRDQVEANARRKLLIPREDDLYAAARGVDRMNARRRSQCGGNPVPPGALEEAQPVRAEPAPSENPRPSDTPSTKQAPANDASPASTPANPVPTNSTPSPAPANTATFDAEPPSPPR
ncbi:MAG TPA: hypothetical protein VGK73_31160 [Polyangiaceae bacterium]